MLAFLNGIVERLRAQVPASPDDAPVASSHAVLEALVAPLPDFARDEFVRRAASDQTPPQSAEDLFERVHGWAIGAGIAEGRGGFPGRRGTPGWTDYVELQRRNVAIFHALVDAFGEPPPSLTETFREYERDFPPPVRLMGEGYEPHVDDVAGRLVYSLPVDSGMVGVDFSFPIRQADLDVLLRDPHRRAVLEVVAHTVLQRSMTRGAAEVTEIEFGRIVERVLHSAAEELSAFIADVNRDHNVRVDHYVREAMARREAARSGEASVAEGVHAVDRQ